MKKNILVIITVLILSLSMLSLLRMNVAKADNPWTLSDSKLNSLLYGWGPATATITDISGPGVQFAYTGLTASGTAYKRDYDHGFGLTADWGGVKDKDGNYHNFTVYTSLKLLFNNTGSSTLTVCLFMNTGFTSEAPYYGLNDTFWQGDWTDVPAGQSRVVSIDFLSATCYNAANDPEPSYVHDDGWRGPIFRLDQATNVGLQVLRNPAGDGTGTIIVSGYTTPTLYIDPSSVQKTYADVTHTFDVTVQIAAVTDLFGFDINVTWDNSLITFVSADYSTYMDSIWSTWSAPIHANSIDDAGAGTYKLVAVSTATGFSTLGNQTILKLTFTVMDPLTNSMKTTPLHFYTDKLSDSNSQSITHTTTDGNYQIWGQTPTLSITNSTGGNSRTCRKLSEPFNITVGISNAASLTSVTIQINYNNTMISYQNGIVNWGTGNVIDDGNGHVTITLSGSVPASTLATINFTSNPAFTRIWKDPSTGQSSNIFSNSTAIYLYSATLSYPSPQPTLSYTRGESPPHQINPPTSDISYSFMPIKGDINNDGTVGIGDLAAVAGVYDTNNAYYNLIGGSPYLVDIFDLVIIASNFFYTYSSTP